MAQSADRVCDFIASNRKLRDAAEFIPEEICKMEFRRRVINSRIDYLFDSAN